MSDERLKQWRDILIRTGKTFIEAFLGYLTIDGFFGVTDTGALKRLLLSMLVGAAAAGFTAVWNALIQWLTIRIDECGTEEEIEEAISDIMEGDHHGENE